MRSLSYVLVCLVVIFAFKCEAMLSAKSRADVHSFVRAELDHIKQSVKFLFNLTSAETDKVLPFEVQHLPMPGVPAVLHLLGNNGVQIINAIIKSAPAGMLMVQGGARIGEELEMLSKRGHQVLAFEPDPISFKKASKVASTLPTVTLKHAGLADKPGNLTLNMELGEGDHQGSSFAYKISGGNTVSVPVTTLDLEIKPTDYVHLLLLDVQGFESKILRGGLKTLQRTRWIFLEFADFLQRAGDSSGVALLKMLTDASFICLDHLWRRSLSGAARHPREGEEFPTSNDRPSQLEKFSDALVGFTDLICENMAFATKLPNEKPSIKK